MKNCQRDDVTVRIHRHTHKHSLIHMQLCLWREEGRGGEVMLSNTSLPNSHLFTNTLTHALTHSLIHIGEWVHSLCLFVPYLISIKTIQLPPLVPSSAICNLHAKCIAWVQRWMCKCECECVWVSVLWIDLSLSVCAFDLQFVSLASFFYVRFGHSCNFICPLKGGGGSWGSGSGIHKSPLLSALNGYSYFSYMLVN